jgi:hypothetical protein
MRGNLGYTPYNSSNPAGYTSNWDSNASIGLSGGTAGMTFLLLQVVGVV